MCGGQTGGSSGEWERVGTREGMWGEPVRIMSHCKLSMETIRIDSS